MAQKDFKHLVRVANTDLDGSKPLIQAIQKIVGVGPIYANMVCKLSKLDKQSKTGELSDADVKKINDIVSNPNKYGAPSWLLNRRNDYETGEDKHLLTGDLKFQKENDCKRLQKTKSYRGLRLAWGLPVRGQKTKSNFRRSKSRGGGGLGVKRKK